MKAGWYPEPERNVYRYWTGEKWSGHEKALGEDFDIFETPVVSDPPRAYSNLVQMDNELEPLVSDFPGATDEVFLPTASRIKQAGVYVYSYPSYSMRSKPMFKIGMTEKSTIEKRVKSQSRKTEIPESAVLIRAIPCLNPRDLESYLHKKFSRHRNSGGGTEWFQVDLEQIDRAVSSYLYFNGSVSESKFTTFWDSLHEPTKTGDWSLTW